MPRIQAPDGTQIDFPDTMKDAEIEAAMGNLYPATPGTEKTGLPGVPKPPLPTGGNDFLQHRHDPTAFSQTALNAVARPADLATRDEGPITGFINRGIEKIKAVLPDLAGGRKAKAGADMLEGAGSIYAPEALPSAIASPVATAAQVAGGYAGGKLAGAGARALQASPDSERLATDAGSVLGGAATLSPKVRAFGVGMGKSAMKPTQMHIGRIPVSVPVPAPIAGGVAGSYIGAHFGNPGAGAAIGAIAPLVRGGMEAASGVPWLPETIPNSFVPSSQKLLNRGGIVVPPSDVADASYVRGASAMTYPPNPARAIEAGGTVRQMPGDIAIDGSFVRGVPAMTQPPNPARALSAGSAPIVTPAPIDASFVRGVDGQYPEVLKGPLTPSEAALPSPPPSVAASAPKPNGGTSDHSSITSQYRPSRTRARFDVSGKRVGG